MKLPVLPVSLTGQEHEIAAGDYRACIVEVGAALRELRVGDRPLLDGFGADETPAGAHGQLLVPWPNRIDHGRYRFDGEDRQLDITEPAKSNAIHGLARWANWTLIERETDRLLLGHRVHAKPGYPHVLDLTVEYRLDAYTGLTVRMAAINSGPTAAPYAHGAHPYLTAGTPLIDECTVQIPGRTWLPTDERGIPTAAKDVAGTPYDFREPSLIADTKIDYAYGNLLRDEEGWAWVTLRSPDNDAVSLWVDDTFPWVEIFTGDKLPERKRRKGLGVEPMSAPPNAFATGEGVTVLQPGESTTGTWGIVAR